MLIRHLRSSLPADYHHEFQSIGITLTEKEIPARINPHYTFKFLKLSDTECDQLRSVLSQHGIPHWYSGQTEMIASFLNPEQLQTTGGDLEKLSEKLGHMILTVHRKLLIHNWEYRISGSGWSIDRPLLMGILNVTPDSFSDGGLFFDVEKAVQHAVEMADSGADIIDIGAESTRPGAREVPLEEEWQRLQPVLKKLKGQLAIPLSVDTYKAEIARRALQAGADIINDVSGLTFDSEMTAVIAEADCPVILMHIKGTPRDMQQNPHYDHLMEEIYQFFYSRIELAQRAGIQQLILDPGLGFGKRMADNYEIIRRTSEFRIFGFPILLGPSRKSFIGRILDMDYGNRLMGTAAACALGIVNGASMVRVHDVLEIRQVMAVVDAVKHQKFFKAD